MNRRPLALIASPLLAILMLGVVPLVLVLVWSFWTWDPATYWIKPDLSLAGYSAILDAGRWTVIVSTLLKAAGTAALCVVLAFPIAYAVHFLSGPRLQTLLLALITIPFFTSYLIRAFSWRLVLGRTGIVNTTLQQLGLTQAPLDWLLFSNFAVVVGLVASYLPFAVFPLVLAFRRVSPDLMAAAQDLGAGFWRAVLTILVPLTMSGIFAGFLFVFVMVAGSSTEVQMLGGAGASIVSVMINDVMRVANYPLAFAISTVVLAVIFALVLIGNAAFGLASLFGEEER
ncbi:ABC transporter permease [Ferranicluibacter rubi]|uniref:ABC transporter permease n=1 Tax=Ferranicluibacter rubi TaxID=2715133 RepID=A0AA44CB82_9HYPH|nr:ABC transporter permease [Ferranicluibacter rubi]NHT76940.1 ABC transporter permease [Ferranicluibacter rubi]PYE31680.1 putative spermidine/putrescine transport system permease protein [Rhizobium sp. PP-WC-1G-195]TCQ04315.1 putative spermidine/putrescine transport system permease protein [Rhizobium sp. PP-F2F-G36]TCQ25783.1 putative spermidine/putrescine transport system permease protein [Rhizobium sp. PP-CC-3G-465]